MRNKKAFTLTEILATLAIIGVIIAIAIPSFSALQKKFKEDYYKSLQETIVTSAKNYYKDHPEEKPTGTLYSSAISLKYLKEKKYVDNVSAYNSNDACTGYVVVVKEEEDYTYNTCMKCSSDKEYNNATYCQTDLATTTKEIEGTLKEVTINTEDKIVNSSYGIVSNIKVVSSDAEISGTIAPIYLPHVENFNMSSIYADFIKKDLIFTPVIKRAGIEVAISENYSPVNISHITLGIEGGEYTVNYKINEKEHKRDIYVKWIGNVTADLSEVTITFAAGFEKEKYEFKGLEGLNEDDDWVGISADCDVGDNKSATCSDVTGYSKYRAVYEYEKSAELKFYTSSSEEIIDTSYTLTIDPNEGTWNGIASEQRFEQEYGSTKEIQKPTRTGYTFDEWELTGGGSFNSTTNTYTYGAGNAKLKAEWIANNYSVVYNGNGNTGGSMSSSTHTYGDEKELTTNLFTKEGYTFAGWATSASGNVVYSDGATVKNLTTTNNETVNLYAKWIANNYSVVYNGNGNTGGSMSSSTHTYGDEKELTTNLFTKEGYTFAGWATSASGNVVYSDEATVKNLTTTNNETVNLYAKWTPNTYTITYEGNKFNTDDSGIVSYDPSTSIITLNGTQTQKISLMNLGHTSMPKGRKYSIQLQYKSGSISGNYASFVTDITKNVNSTPATRVYKSVELKNNTNTTLTLEINDTAVNDNRKNMYVWIYNDGNIVYNNYKLKVVITEVSQYDIQYNSNYTFPSNPTRFGYTFDGWYTEENGNGTNITATSKVTGNKKLYAKWTPNSYILTIDPNGGSWSGSANSQPYTQQYRSEKNIPDPIRDGYTFTGWTLTGGGRFNSTTKTYTYGTSNGTLTASWRKNKVTIKYKIQGNEGIVATTTGSDGTISNWTAENGIIKRNGAVFTTVIQHNSTIGGSGLAHPQNSQYMNIKNAGYKAVVGSEWKDANGNTYNEAKTDYTAYDFCDISNGDCEVELYVNWTPAVQTISFDKKGGYDGTDQIYQKYGVGLYSDSAANMSITSINIPRRTGYTFLGYYYDINGVTYRYISSDGSFGDSITNSGVYKAFDEDVTLYAIWDDTQAPTCSIELGGSLGENDWYVSDVVAQLTYSDNEDVTTYGISTTKNSTNMKTSYTRSSNTTGMTIYGYVEDPSGNTGTCQATFKLDKTAPSVPVLQYTQNGGTNSGASYTPGDWTNADSISRKIAATDYTTSSKIAKFEWSNDTSVCGTANESSNYGTEGFVGDPTSYTNGIYYTISYNPSSSNYACFRAVDNAGNKSNWSSEQQIKFDRTPPTCYWKGPSLSSTDYNDVRTAVQPGQDLYLQLVCQDDLSGIKEFKKYEFPYVLTNINYQFNEVNNKTENTSKIVTYKLTTTGSTNSKLAILIFAYEVVDNAGNLAYKSSGTDADGAPEFDSFDDVVLSEAIAVRTNSPEIAIVATDGSYNGIPNNSRIFKGTTSHYSVLIKPNGNTISSVKMDSKGACSKDTNTEFFNKKPEYNGYTRYYCGSDPNNSVGTFMKGFEVKYGTNTETFNYEINVVDRKCDGNIDITPLSTANSAGWYKTSPLSIQMKSNMKYSWATDSPDCSSGIGFETDSSGKQFCKFWTKTGTNNGGLSQRTTSPYTRDYLIKLYDDLGQSVECNTSEVKIDATGPTVSLDMRALGYYTTNETDYTSEDIYTYNASSAHEGYVYVTLTATDSASGIKSKSCKITGPDATRRENEGYSTTFSAHGHIMASGLTTITCTAKDNADNITTKTYYVYLSKKHTHDFGSRCIDESCSNSTKMLARDYYSKYYDSWSPNTWEWRCTNYNGTSHPMHRTKKTDYYYLRTCKVCGETATQININENGAPSTGHSIWWCPGNTQFVN